MPTIFLSQPPPISRVTKPSNTTTTKAPTTSTALPHPTTTAPPTTTLHSHHHFTAPTGTIKKSVLRKPECATPIRHTSNDDDDLDNLTTSLSSLAVTNTTPATDYDILSAQLAIPAYIQWQEEVEPTVDEHGVTIDVPTGYWTLQLDRATAPKNCTSPKRPYRLSSLLYDSLYPHQRECLRWMFSLHLRYSKQPSTGFLYGEGGILADDMGLGKTVQIAAYLAGLFASSLCKRVLIVVPAGTIDNWQNELSKWFSMQTGWKSQSNKQGIRIHQFHGSNRKTRSDNLEKVKRIGGIILTTPDMLKKNMEEVCDFSEVQPSVSKNARSTNDSDTESQPATPRGQKGSNSSSSKLAQVGYDYIIIDEAHLIKSMKTQISVAVRAVPATHRLLVTGTPLQNKLEELYSLMDFITFSSSLGSIVTFKKHYIQPIEDGTDRDADADEIVHSRRVAAQLKQLIAPYILRRQKADIDLTSLTKSTAATIDSAPTNTAPPTAIQKNELIIWLKLSPKQSELYKAFTQSEEVKMALNSAKHPLIQLNVIKKICDHPRLLAEKLQASEELAHLDFTSKNTSAIIEESQKLAFLTELIQRLKAEGHRTLIFSSSTVILNLIQNVLYQHLHWPQAQVLRIDGTVNGDGIRQRLVDQFNGASAAEVPVMLLSTGAGAEGLNLTGADRVIIYDPAWNPSKDNQAIGRAFRIGQTRNVVAYRLVTCGTVEEVIYRNQIFKSSLIRAAVEVHRQAPTPDAKRRPAQTPSKQFEAIDLDKPGYFTKSELREVFTLFDHAESTTCQQLQTLHPPSQRKGYEQLEAHIGWIQTSSSQVYGVTDHDLLFSDRIRPQVDQATPAKAQPPAELPALAAIVTPPRRVYTYTDFTANPAAHKKPAAQSNTMFSRPNADQVIESATAQPTLLPAAPQSCIHHRQLQSADGEYSFQGQSCQCHLSAEHKQHYQQLLSSIPTVEQLQQPSTSHQRLQQLDSVLNALEVCDDDPLLHLTAMRLGVEVAS